VPEISLQAYENEIDQLIEQARYLEALAHVRCILGQYPRYIGAYYLLGETMLEVDLPGLAADMFRRALSANPEHLMARIGLGLAHEHSNNLDASIWNLLRALELDPGNNDIGDELCRMYGQRDGLEPDYIPRTPAGLARLYIKGNRSGRAVTQLRALLDEEPARPDLMTALAEAYWRNEQIVQASDMCQEILDKMPHNCKANLLLGTLWVNGGQEEGWAYLQRAQEVDPENTMAEALFGSESLLEPQPVNIDRLVYDPDAVEVDQQSAWFKRLGAASITAGISEAPPEMTESEMRLVDITAGLESQIEIPDWLRELGAPDEEDAGGLGWMADLSAEVAPEISEDIGLVEGDVFDVLDDTLPLQEPLEEPQLLAGEAEEASPDWLQELTIQEMSFDVDESEGAPDWLMELVGEEGGAEDTPPVVAETAAEESSDRLAGLLAEDDAGDLDALTREAVSGEEAAWLADLGTPDETDAGALDWLGELQSTVVEEGAAGTMEAATDEVEVSELGDVPDWLKVLEPEAEAGVVAPGAAEDQAASEDEAVPEWLAELAPAMAEAEPAVAAESEVGDLEEEAVPDWLAELTESPDGAPEPSGVDVEEETPDWLRDLDVGEDEPAGESLTVLESPEFVKPDVEEDGVLTGAGALSWLDSLTADMEEDQPVAVVVEGPTDDETLELTIPTSEVVEAEIPPVDAAAWADEVPDEQSEMLSGDDALTWLQSLTVGKEEELRALAEAESEARVAEIPGRKAATSPSVAVEEPAEVEAEVVEEADIAAPSVTEPEVSEVEIAPLKEEEEPLSGDDALAWLESLAAGKEEELQVQAEPEPVVAQMPETVLEAPEMEELASAVVAPDTAVETAVGELLEEESDLLSGDDAVAWLESLVVGKEDELRVQAETESEARVDEILGHEPAVREPEPEPGPEPEAEIAVPTSAEMDIVDLAAAEPSATLVETPADEDAEAPTEQEDLMSGDDALAWLQSLTAGTEDELRVQAEAAPVEPELVEAETVIAEPPDVAVEVAKAEPAVEAPEVAVEEELEAGEDAATWLSELSPEKASELEAQLESEGEAAVPDQEGDRGYFGWSAFGGEPEEVPAPTAALEVVAADESAEPEPALPDLPAVEPEVATAEPVEDVAPRAEIAAPPAEVAEPIVEKPAVVEQPATAEEPVMEAEVPPSEAPATALVVETVEIAAPSAAEEVPAPVEMRPEAEPSAVTAEDLDEMRAYTKRKRSDHAARLSLARALWYAGEIQESMQNYGRLIKSGARSDEVMADLEQYVESGPPNASVMRTFGDAYMKFGDLDKALEIYNRAVDLL